MSILQLSREKPLNIAHRGARSLAPENTLAAAQKAAESGADMWELDLQATRDGEIVVVHDSTLERTSNVLELFPRRWPSRVCDFTFQELRELDFGSWFETADPFGQIALGMVSQADLQCYRGQRLPTLSEALEFTRGRGMGVNLEIKDLNGRGARTALLEKIIAEVVKWNMTDDVIVSSFQHDVLKEWRQLDKSIATGVLAGSRLPHPEELVRSLGANAFHPKLGTISPEETHRLRSLGYPVLVWVVNDRDILSKLIKTGISGIFTDFPQTLSHILSLSA